MLNEKTREIVRRHAQEAPNPLLLFNTLINTLEEVRGEIQLLLKDDITSPNKQKRLDELNTIKEIMLEKMDAILELSNEQL